MKIIVTFAVRAEFAPWRRIRAFKRIGGPIYCMEAGGAEVYVLITGIGTRGTDTELRNLLAQPADMCIVSGLAGSLKREHSVGTVLVAKTARRDDTQIVMTSDDTLVKIAIQCEAKPVAFFHTADAVLCSTSEKIRLGETADAVDMESFQIMAEARQHGVPAVAVRAVSDAADQDLPLDFNRATDGAGKVALLSALSQVAAAPGRLPRLIRFGFESSRAARTLAYFLDRYLKCLLVEGELQLNAARTEVR